MPPAKSDGTRDAALLLFREGLSFKEIARKLGVTDVTVGRWAREEKWKKPRPPAKPRGLETPVKVRAKLVSISAIDDKVLQSKSILKLCKAFLDYAMKGIYQITQQDPSLSAFDRLAAHARPVVCAYHQERAAMARTFEYMVPEPAEKYRDE